MAVQKGAKASLRVVNLLDEESDEEAPLVPSKVSSEEMMKRPPQVMDEETLSPERDDDNQEGEKFPLDKFERNGAMDAPKEVL